MGSGIPDTPAEDYFPPNFAAMNVFCQVVAAGPALIMSSEPRASDDPVLMGRESVRIAHIWEDKYGIFEVIRVDDDHFIVRRLSDEPR